MTAGDDSKRAPAPRVAHASVSSGFGEVTRLVIVTDGGATEYWADAWRIDIQDGGRTAKFFTVGTGVAPAAERERQLGAELTRAQEMLQSGEDADVASHDPDDNGPADHQSVL